ncbi:acetyltransferase [Heyndrickxia sporothermodurans]|uniref:acetyltransferase n=1 Tax=Heyndrickxia sporothermodurans TaxID=46224 RepID=UPI002E1FBE6F|nr:acetyltransferase [Heyndrickxia sporothermodurans]
MKDLIIVGAGSAGREILQIAKDINIVHPRWNIKGFIADSGLDIRSLTNGEFDIIGTIDEWNPKPHEEFVCAIADPLSREIVVKKLIARGAFFANLIHPNARINEYCKLGNGIVLYNDSFIGPNATIGDFVFINSKIAHDCEIGNFSTISSQSSILGNVSIGSSVFIGGNATIIPNITVNDNAYVGAGSVVIKNVKSGVKVFGNPARKMNI